MSHVKPKHTRRVRLASLLLLTVVPALSGCVPGVLGVFAFDWAAFITFMPLRILFSLGTSELLNSF